MNLFTSFDGRISRKSFWLGVLGIVVISVVFVFLLGIIFASLGGVSNIILLGFSVAILYPAIAISVKRLHDRNKPAMPWIAIFFVPGFIGNVLQTFQIGYTTMDMNGMPIPVPGTIAMVIGLVSLVVGIWALVELGFLKGTEGENNYGPDPLG